ncbi:tRNA uridine-5-carboxymethylaminomethyl(34) synthesis GTPase MnmE [Arenibaculum pallidiluteum]|uniref:tRNA uridine-5-carboxymethylaminomethyl(34) synthesis GTPase MnmE n=1 Tax=Arenibaculum pallidiluteum TaxID=2812559 RepID=UPI001A9729E7|nr:tRNA uridine-5-carboxymethylaminomethyl(34) synthesis GTPase MnmE [Arenibaculum pallidiluteum]
MTDTVFALASAPGRGGVAVMRVSGPAAGGALSALTGRSLPPARRASLARLRDPGTGDPIDTGIVLWFPGPASFTGEDVAEIQVHGGRAVVAALAEALAARPGLRPAEPGEFSRRAFENGRLDLTEAEAIADLVDAETSAQRRQALRQMDGALGRLYEDWRGRLMRALAHLEAEIDFPDEDLPGGVGAAVRPVLEALAGEIADHLDDGHRGERLRDGISVAILGAPNAGKSSLLNALARRDAAIVSETAGTTRDVIEVHLDLGGYPVVLADTAGLREATDAVETEGIRRALARAEAADLRIAVFDAAALPALDARTAALLGGSTLAVVNKIDAHPGAVVPNGMMALSAKTGAGVAAVMGRLEALVAERFGVGQAPALTRARHRAALEDCRRALAGALEAPLPELAAEDVRLAVRALGRITGRVDVEDLLDVIFRDFCIGK